MTVKEDGVAMSKEFQVSAEKYTMKISATVRNKDLLLQLTGGDYPHIGTVTTFSKDILPETLRFPSHDGRFHKDDRLAQVIVPMIQALLPGNCVLLSGVHVDQITQAQIAVSFEMAAQLGEQLQQWLSTNPFSEKEPQYYQKNEKPQ